MREIIRLIEAAQEVDESWHDADWNVSGGWIRPNGEFVTVDRDADHSHSALASKLLGLGSGLIEDDPEDVAKAAGWIRIVRTSNEFSASLPDRVARPAASALIRELQAANSPTIFIGDRAFPSSGDAARYIRGLAR